jgi:D-alanine-D-alanine ligase
MKPRVLVMMGGPSVEHEVSLASGKMVAQALPREKYDVRALVIGRDGRWVPAAPEDLAEVEPRPLEAPLPPADLAETLRGLHHLVGADVVFLALHGRYGEDGTLQGMLETLGVPYTGSGPLASALAMHKQRAKQLLALAGLAVARDVVLEADAIRRDPVGQVERVVNGVGLPAVVKPNQGGSSLGVSLAHDVRELQSALDEASRQDAAVLVEELLVGREFTCPVLETIEGEAEALPVIEIVPHRGPFFDFRSKYETGGADEIVPAPIPEAMREACQAVAVSAHRALGCEGFSRTDMIWVGEGPVALEVNTIPGMTPNSLLPRSARAAGLAFPDLVDHLVQLALARHRRRHASHGSKGSNGSNGSNGST